MAEGSLDLDALRARLASGNGPDLWRGLEELADTPEFRERLRREFPQDAAQWLDPVSRRRFLHLMGASLALAGDLEAAKAAAKHVLAIQPGFRVSVFASWYPLRRPGDLERFAEGLRLAGLPE